jgi:3-hydroxybutyrate dehydrogenase
MYDTSFATRPSARRRRALEGRVAIVTGSTSGIGLGIARTLAENGAAVLLNGFGDAEEIERIRGELANDALGPVDILVNNAGIQHVSPVESFPPHKWDAVIAINLSSAFHMTRLVFAGMKQRGWGRIVNVSSAHGLIASPFKAAYVAAKHGIVGLTKCVALEGAEAGVTCNAICPGYVWTPLVEKQIEDQAKNHGIPREEVIRQILLAQQPNKRFATVEEIGALAAFLCADGGASITGAALPVDGGWTAH